MIRHDEQLLWDYAGHALEQEEVRVLEHHLSECPDCTERLDAVRVAREALDNARLAEAPLAWNKVDDAIGAVVEKRLAQKASRHVRRAMWGGVAGLALAAAALLFFFNRPSQEPTLALPAEVAVAQPEARIDRADGRVLIDRQVEPLKDGARLTGGDVLETSGSARAFIHLPDASHLRVSGSTRLSLNRATVDDVSLTLERGRIAVKASHVARKAFVVRTGGYSVFVVGTVFSVAQRGADVEVAVSEGTVRLESDKGQLMVQAGQLVRLSGKGRARMSKLPESLKQELAEVAATNDTVAAVERRAAVAATGGHAAPRTGGLPRLNATESRARQVELPQEARSPEATDAVASPSPEPVAAQPVPEPTQQPAPQPAPEAARPMDVIVEAPEPVWPTLGGEVMRGVPQVPMPPPSAPVAQPSDDAEREWTAMPAAPAAASVAGPAGGAPSAQEAAPAQAPRAATRKLADDAEAPEAKGVEAIFLTRAEGSMGKGTCERFLPGLEEIAGDQVKTPSSEVARIVRARCLDESLRPRQAAMEFRKYLLEYPSGRFTREAQAAVGQ